MPLTILQSVSEVSIKTKIIRVTSIAKKISICLSVQQLEKFFPPLLLNGKCDSFVLLRIFFHYQHDGFNMFFSSLTLGWVLLLNLCRWVTLSDEFPRYGTGSFCPDLVVVAVCTQEICCPTYSSTSFHWHLFYQLQFCIEMTLSLSLPLVKTTSLYFQEAKTDKAVSDDDTSELSLNHFLLLLILLVVFLLY